MKALPIWIGVLALAVIGSAQEKAPAGGRVAVINLRDATDKARNPMIADIEVELQKQQEADFARATDLNPSERQRIRNKLMELSTRLHAEANAEIVRISGLLAKERGFDLVQGVDADLMGAVERRGILYYDPSVDLTSAVLDRIVAARKK